MKKILRYSLFLFIALISSAFFIVSLEEEKDAKNLQLFSAVFKMLKNEFVDSLDSDFLIRRAIDGMVKSVDPHTVFFDENETRERVKVWQGIRYSGLGAYVAYKDSAAAITGSIEGFGAQQSDLRAGDIYLEIDGKSLKGKTLDETIALLRGDAETVVNITVDRPHVGVIKKAVTRKQIVIKSIPFYTMLDSVTGYIQVQQFLAGSDTQFIDAVKALKKNPQLKSIVLDLRDNIGGLVEQAVNCVNAFVPKNTIVIHLHGKATDYNNITLHEPLDTLMPLVILTNSNTISAGEIFTGALQDLDRAVVIGQKTFGKGLVQGTRFPYEGTSLYVTAARYYTPSGRCIQKRDYTHRYKDGKEEIFADTLKKVFYTKNGRKVYDIGGVQPDIKTDGQPPSVPIVDALNAASLIFNYATWFRNTQTIKAPAETFIIRDADFLNFMHFIEQGKYNFKIAEEEKLKEFEEIAKKNNTVKLFNNKYKQLYAEVADSKKQMLLQNKEQIKKALQNEIVLRYYYNSGLLKNSLTTDAEVILARELLADQKEYSRVLNKK